MKWYWVVACDNTKEKPFVGNEADLKGCNEEILDVGMKVAVWNPKAFVKANDASHDGTPDDVLQTLLGVPVFSKRLRTSLDEWNVNEIQYLPIRIFRPDETEIFGYAIANILTVVPALDCDKSICEYFPKDYFLKERVGKIRGVRQVSLKKQMLEGHHLIRLKEYLAPIYVSEIFKKAFESGYCTGYSFHEVGVA